MESVCESCTSGVATTAGLHVHPHRLVLPPLRVPAAGFFDALGIHCRYREILFRHRPRLVHLPFRITSVSTALYPHRGGLAEEPQPGLLPCCFRGQLLPRRGASTRQHYRTVHDPGQNRPPSTPVLLGSEGRLCPHPHGDGRGGSSAQRGRDEHAKADHHRPHQGKNSAADTGKTISDGEPRGTWHTPERHL